MPEFRQKWFLFHSTEQQKRKEKTFEKKIEAELEKSRKSLKRLTAKRFACGMLTMPLLNGAETFRHWR